MSKLHDFTLRYPKRKKVANNTYIHRGEAGNLRIRLHATDIVEEAADGTVTLHSGGWRTITTKGRMNEWLPPGFRINQERGAWYLDSPSGRYVYQDWITIHSDGSVTGAGESDVKQEQRKLLKRARKYSREFMAAFVNGEVPAPGSGDCFGCLLVTAEGKAPMGGPDHILSHMDESYFVPALLHRAAKRFATSTVAQQALACVWDPNGPGVKALQASYFGKIGCDQLEKAVYRYVKNELGFAS